MIPAHAEDSPRLVHATIRRSGSNEAFASLEGAEAAAIEMTGAPVEEAPAVAVFHQSSSEATIQGRFFRGIELNERLTHERLARICYGDYSREIALVVETNKKPHSILGIARLRKSLASEQVATFSLIVGDPWQKKGLGYLILSKLLSVAAFEKINSLQAIMQEENHAMKKLCERLGFEIQPAQKGYLKIFKKI